MLVRGHTKKSEMFTVVRWIVTIVTASFILIYLFLVGAVHAHVASVSTFIDEHLLKKNYFFFKYHPS